MQSRIFSGKGKTIREQEQWICCLNCRHPNFLGRGRERVGKEVSPKAFLDGLARKETDLVRSRV